MTAAPRPRTNNSVDRALEVLGLIARERKPQRFIDLQRRLNVPKGTLHPLLASLTAAGFLERGTDGAYLIGLTAFEVGTAFHRHSSLRDLVGPALDKLLDAFNETSHFGTLAGGDVVYIDRRDCSHEVRYGAPLGERKPAYSTGLGKAMLAALTDREIRDRYPERLSAITGRTIGSLEALLHQIAVIRKRGYATEDEESTPGVRCIAVAAPTPNALYGLSVTVPVQRATMEQLEDYLPALTEAADDIRAKLSAMEWLNNPSMERR